MLDFLGIRPGIIKPSILERRQAAIPVLIDLIKAENSYVSREAIIALGHLGPGAEEAIPSLKEVLTGKNSCNSLEVLCSLRCMGPEGVAVLYEALHDERSEIRGRAAFTLVVVGPVPKSAVPSLIELLKDKDDCVRWQAALALGGGAPEGEAVPSLIELLKDEHSTVRCNAAGALGSFGPAAKAAVPTLIELMKDNDNDVAVTAAWALTEIDRNAAEEAGASKFLSTH